MDKFLETQLQKLACGQPPSADEYRKLVSKLDFAVDDDFLEIMRLCTRPAGFISPNRYVMFWPIEDMVDLNPYYDEIEESDRLFFFGSDGSNLGYAIDKTNGNFVAIDFLDVGSSEPTTVSETFIGFLRVLADSK